MFGQACRVAGGVHAGQQVPNVRLVHPVGAAELLGRGQADVDVGAERFGDLGAQVLTDCSTGHPAENLAEDETEGGHVIALGGARLPPRFRGGQLLTDKAPVGDFFPAHPGARPDYAGSVAHHHGQGDVFLARLPELGPVAGHRSLQVQLSAVGELVDAGGRQAFGTGQHRGQGVLLPLPGTSGVSRAAPQVDDQVPVDPHRDGRADFVAQRKVALERVAYSYEVRRARAMDVDVCFKVAHGAFLPSTMLSPS